MRAHLVDEHIVGFLDGTIAPRDAALVSSHLEGCCDCRRRLSALAAFDEFVQSNRPEDDAATAAMFDLSQQLLARPLPSRRWLRFPILLAAAILVAAAIAIGLAQRGPADPDVEVVRYAVVEPTRSATVERLHLRLSLAATAHVIVFAKLPTGEVVQLLPDGDSFPIGPGPVRLPADELLDWEYAADAMPRELLVVFAPALPARDLLTRLDDAWASAVGGIVPALATDDGRSAHLVSVPGGR